MAFARTLLRCSAIAIIGLAAAHPGDFLASRWSRSSKSNTGSRMTLFLGNQASLCLSVSGIAWADRDGQRRGKLETALCATDSGGVADIEQQAFQYNSADKTLRPVSDPLSCVVTDNGKLDPGTTLRLLKCQSAGQSKLWMKERFSLDNGDTYERIVSSHMSVCLGYDGQGADINEWATLTPSVGSGECFLHQVSSGTSTTEVPTPTWTGA